MMLLVKWIMLVMFLSSTFQFVLSFSLNLTTEQSSICPEVTFICTAVDLPSTVLRWLLNEDEFAIYGVDETHQYPLTVVPQNATYSSLVGGVDIQMLSASPNRDNQDIASFISKMTVNILALRKAGTSTVSCGSLGRKQTVNIKFDSNREHKNTYGTQETSHTDEVDIMACGWETLNRMALMIFSDILEASLSVTVLVDGEIVIQSSIILASISASVYTDYTSTISIQHPCMVPVGISVEPRYSNNSILYQLIVAWNETVLSDEYCFHIVNYTVVLIDSVHNETVMEIYVGHDSCQDGTCIISLDLSLSNFTYRVGLIATNIIGSSNISSTKNVIYGSIASLFSHSLKFESCVTTAGCFTTLSDKGNCTLEYGQDASYQDLGAPISAPLNSSFPLPLMEFSTLYYIQITFTLNYSEPIILRRNYTTGISSSLFSPLQVFLTMFGLLLLVSTVSFVTTWIIALNKCFNLKMPSVTRKKLYVMILVILLTSLISVFVWIVAFSGSLTSNCSQSRGNGFIVSAFMISTGACIILITMIVSYHCKKRKITVKKNKVYGIRQAECSIGMKQNTVYGIKSTKQQSPSHFYEHRIPAMTEMPERDDSSPDDDMQNSPHPDCEYRIPSVTDTPSNDKQPSNHEMAEFDKQHSSPHECEFGITEAKKDEDRQLHIYEEYEADDSCSVQHSPPHIYELGITTANEEDESHQRHSPPHEYEYGNTFINKEDVPSFCDFHDYECI